MRAALRRAARIQRQASEVFVMYIMIRFFTALFLAICLMGSGIWLSQADSMVNPLDVPQAGAPPTRRALLIGIDTYKPEPEANATSSGPVVKATPNRQSATVSKGGAGGRGEFSNLSGPQNDVKEMRTVIEKK